VYCDNEVVYPLEISLSVIIPVYNEERYLEATLRSVRTSELDYLGRRTRLSVTISNNGSTDRSRDIIESFSKKYPHWNVINSSINISGDEHFNSLIRDCKTEFVCIIGGHDLVSRSYFYSLENTLRNNPKSPLCFSEEYLDQEGTGETAKKVDFSYNFSEDSNIRFWQSIFYLSNATCIQGVIRTKLLQAIDAHKAKVSDLVWLHGLLKWGSFSYTDDAVYIRMNPIRPNNYTNPKIRKLRSLKEPMSIGLLSNWKIDNLYSILLARIIINNKFSLNPYRITVFRIVRKISQIFLPAATQSRTISDHKFQIHDLLND
jgi:glycosyltransferase involved in cell wall biosynthesis